MTEGNEIKSEKIGASGCYLQSKQSVKPVELSFQRYYSDEDRKVSKLKKFNVEGPWPQEKEVQTDSAIFRHLNA